MNTPTSAQLFFLPHQLVTPVKPGLKTKVDLPALMRRTRNDLSIPISQLCFSPAEKMDLFEGRTAYLTLCGYRAGLQGLGKDTSHFILSSAGRSTRTTTLCLASPQTVAEYILQDLEARTLKAAGRPQNKSPILLMQMAESASRVFACPIDQLPVCVTKALRSVVKVELKQGQPQNALEIATEVAKIILDRTKLGRQMDWSISQIQKHIHLVDVEKLIYVMGWYESQYKILSKTNPEIALILARNFKSVCYRALASGDVNYPVEVVESLPQMWNETNQKIKTIEDSEIQAICTTHLDSIMYHALNSKDFSYPVQAIKWLLRVWPDVKPKIEAIANPEIKTKCEKNLVSIIRRTFNSGDLKPIFFLMP